MAKYRITSIPQSLPKAQKGLFKNKLDIKTPQNKFKNLFDKGVLDNKGYINLFGKNKKGNSTAPLWEAQSIPVFPSQESSIEDVMPKRTTEEQANVFPTINPDLSGSNTFQFKPSGVGINTDTGNCPNGQYFYRGQCVSEDVLYTIMLRENEIEDFQSSERINNTLNKIAEERARLAEEKENKDWEEMMQKREEAFKTSKKYDKIEPLYTIDSEGYTDEDLAGFQESGFFAVKDPKTNKINLYPTNEINSRIINNGLRTNEIVNKLGIGDEKLIQGAFGDLMKAADEEYGSTVRSKLLEKSLDEGISLEEAAKRLSGKLGTEKGIQNYIKPTKELINTLIDDIKADINKPTEKELKSMYFDNRDPNATYSPKIDYNSADPGLKYNMDYYNTTGDWGKFLKDYSDYNKEYNKEYADSFYNKQNQNADRLNLPVSLQPETLKNQLDLTNQNILLTKKIGDASAEAGNQTINKKYIEQLQADMARASDPLVKYELSKKLDAVKNNPEAFSKLLKKFDAGEALTKEDEDNINALTFNILQNESQDAIKDLRIKPELTTKDKVLDVLANPFDAFKYSNQGGLNNMWSSGMGYNERKLLERANPGLDLGTQDNLVGNALNTWNPMRFARDVDSDLDRGDYESAGLEALEFASPFIFSKAARAGRLARDANKFFPTGKIAPGLRGFTGAAFDAMNPYFAYEAIRPGGDFNRSYDAFQSGDVLGGLEEGAYGALGLLGVNGARGIKGFNTPLTKPFNANRVAFKKGGSLPTYQGPIRSIVKSIAPKLTNLALKTGIKTLQLPGVKPFFRSNYNPISYPIKLLGEKIARQSSAPYRNKQDIIDALTKKAAPEKKIYFGNVNMGTQPEYGYGKRDLIANYFRGIDTGFKPIDYDIYSDPGLKKYIDRYGHLKTYELNSEIKHGDPLDILSLATNMTINSKNPVFKDKFSYSMLGPDHSVIDYFQMPGLEDYYYGDYMNNLPGTSFPSLYEAQRQYYKKMLHQHFDEQGIESLDLDVDPKVYRTNFLNYNPIFPKDNLAGHMAVIKRTPDKKDFEFTTRDIWKFTPDDYLSKWDPSSKQNSLFKHLQIEGMDTFGKPFVLTQTNPIRFKKGGSVELELTPKQIKEYIKKGYIIEDI